MEISQIRNANRAALKDALREPKADENPSAAAEPVPPQSAAHRRPIPNLFGYAVAVCRWNAACDAFLAARERGRLYPSPALNAAARAMAEYGDALSEYEAAHGCPQGDEPEYLAGEAWADNAAPPA